MTAQEVIEVAEGCAGIISGLEPLNRDVIHALTSLRCISRLGSGLDNVDLTAAQEHGVTVKNTPMAPVRAVAEMALGLILDLLRGLSRHDRRIRSGTWKKEPGKLLSESVVGVLGLGRIGRAVAEMLSGLGAQVRGTDPALSPAWAEKTGLIPVPLPRLLEVSDVVTIHVSRGPGEPPLIGAAELSAMKPGACLVNLSRGQVVDEDALFRALTEGPLAGAALDVFCSEPYQGPLTELDNVILTPHIGSSTYETVQSMERQAVENLIEVLEGGRT
jgi:D-3-phosphoglycerate dehydrogenase